MLNAIDVDVSDLVLDPNNPRFVKDLTIIEKVPEDALVESEVNTLRRFNFETDPKDEDVTNTNDLYKSMRSIGYVPIDRVVVRRIQGTNKFLVIEGNRRISTVKKLLKMLEPEAQVSAVRRKEIELNRKSFETIPCKLMDTDGLSEDEVSHRISVILGIRHHGSLLEWDPLPRAYNIYNEYMNLGPTRSDSFVFDNKQMGEVSARLSISSADVKKALKTYIAYLQLGKLNPAVEDRHYSLIESAVTNGPMMSYYLKVDNGSYELDEDSLEKLNSLCQFQERDNASSNVKKIINDPKAMGRFGMLIKKLEEQAHPEARNYVYSQVTQVLDEENVLTLEQAIDNATSYVNRSRWVEAVDKLMVERESKLKFEDYTGTANDLAAKESLKTTLLKLRRAIIL